MSAEKTNSQAGFSLIEMTVVLAILAIGATTAMSVVNNRLEEAVTTRTVADLRVVAEAAYECYVAGNCKDADNGGWASSITTATGGVSANTILGDLGDYLPVGLSDRYKFKVLSPNADGIVKRAKVRVDMENPGSAKRVARTFGSSAEATNTFVVVTLGIPGTERAIYRAKEAVKEEIKSNDLVFTNKHDISGVGDVSVESATIGGVRLRARESAALVSVLSLSCPSGLAVDDGVFMCSPETPAPPAPITCNGVPIGQEIPGTRVVGPCVVPYVICIGGYEYGGQKKTTWNTCLAGGRSEQRSQTSSCTLRSSRC